MRKLGLIIGGLAFLAMMACSSTKITSSWRADNVKQLSKENKILVMALVPQKELALRSQMENYIVAALKNKGYNAVSALQQYGPQEFGKMNEKQVIKQLKGSDINKVMTIVMLDKAREKNFIPGTVYESYPYGYYGFWPYYSLWYSRIYTPGYYTYNTRYQWESNLYELESGQLLYSVQSKSFDPPTTERMAILYAHEVIKDMLKHQLLAQ